MDKANEKIVGISIDKIEKGLHDLLLHKNYIKELKGALAKSVLDRIQELRGEFHDEKKEAAPEFIEQGAIIDDLYTFLDIFDNCETYEFIAKKTGESVHE